MTGLHVSGGPESAQRVRDQLNAKLTHGRAYLRPDLPERYHLRETPRAGDVIVVMDEGWMMATSIINRGLIQNTWGEHGWAPDVASMRAIFLIAGPGISKGVTIPEVENVDVYPLMTELTGVEAGGWDRWAPRENQRLGKGALISLAIPTTAAATNKQERHGVQEEFVFSEDTAS